MVQMAAYRREAPELKVSATQLAQLELRHVFDAALFALVEDSTLVQNELAEQKTLSASHQNSMIKSLLEADLSLSKGVSSTMPANPHAVASNHDWLFSEKLPYYDASTDQDKVEDEDEETEADDDETKADVHNRNLARFTAMRELSVYQGMHAPTLEENILESDAPFVIYVKARGA